MSVKGTGQLGFSDLALSGRRGSPALERVASLVDWGAVERTLSGLREEGPGRPGYRPLLMFKALNTLLCTSARWIRIEPPPSSQPFKTMS